MIDFEKLPFFKKHAFRIVELIPEWSRAYEATPEAIEKQIPIAHAWICSNPTRAPKKHLGRFLNTWMKKAKEYGNLVEKKQIMCYNESKTPDEEIMTGDDFAKMREELRRRKWEKSTPTDIK